MSAPALWIAVPLAVGAVAWLLLTERAAALAGGLTCMFLALVALVVPIDTALQLGPVSIKIAATASLLGRSLVLSGSEGPLLVMLFGISAAWFFGAEVAGVARRLVPGGLVVAGLLVASLAVEPFLYAALLIEMAALAAIPLLVPEGTVPGRSAIKFLTYQTLGMPCILLAGWLLEGVETSPGDLALTVQATVTLSVGFAFLLAIVPLHDWIPGMMAESHPYITGFLLWLMPTVIVIFGLSFLDRYAWLRTSAQIISGLRILGLIMLVASGVGAALERNLGRMMGHAVAAETGLLILAASLTAAGGADTIFPFFIPRGLGLLVWAVALSILHRSRLGTDIESLKQFTQAHPWASSGLLLAALSSAGFPLLAGFPPRIDVWAGLSEVSRDASLWYLLGLSGLMVGAIRQLNFAAGSRHEKAARRTESLLERGVMAAGMAVLVLLGLFPRAVAFLVVRLPLMFEHLAR